MHENSILQRKGLDLLREVGTITTIRETNTVRWKYTVHKERTYVLEGHDDENTTDWSEGAIGMKPPRRRDGACGSRAGSREACFIPRPFFSLIVLEFGEIIDGL